MTSSKRIQESRLSLARNGYPGRDRFNTASANLSARKGAGKSRFVIAAISVFLERQRSAKEGIPLPLFHPRLFIEFRRLATCASGRLYAADRPMPSARFDSSNPTASWLL
jgi:hypothetical protein